MAGRRSHFAIEAPPFALCALMVVIGATTSALAHIRADGLYLPYLSTAVAITFLSTLCFVFLEVAQLARSGEEDPLRKVGRKLQARLSFLLLPAVALPLFLASFAAAKSSIPFLVGYSWDGFWAAADRLLFGDDAWRIAHRIFGSSGMPFWEWFYTVAWGGALFCSSAFVALYSKPRKVGVFFTAMFATWIVGGCIVAYAFSAAGPVFAHLFEPAIGRQFDPLTKLLQGQLGHGAVAQTQRYLASVVGTHIAEKGGGISAMPSMHLAAAAVYVFAARRSLWIIPATLFWIVIFVGSAYFGYHYAVDGIAGALVAGLCWVASAAWYRMFDQEGSNSAAELHDLAVTR